MIMQNDAVIQQILDRTEKRIEQFGTVDKSNLKVIAVPVSLDRPMIQPSRIYDLYKSWHGAKRVSGGVCIFTEPPDTEPSDDDSDKALHLYTELNEYGVVYYRSHLYEEIRISDFINNINSLLKHTTELYKACDTSAVIRIHASVNNVFRKELARDLGTGRSIPPHVKPVCYDSEVCVSTAETYDSADFDKAEHRKTILEELTMPLLWAFNVPIEKDSYAKYVTDLISKSVEN